MTSMHATNKPFNIEKRLVYEAYKAVKSNGGAAGVDDQTIEQFEADLSGNLYKIWNRMSSGTYFPPPVRAVAIPKKSGGERILGVPTVADRVAQTVVKNSMKRRDALAAGPVRSCAGTMRGDAAESRHCACASPRGDRLSCGRNSCSA
jgi:retron-type reverse transcriptase